MKYRARKYTFENKLVKFEKMYARYHHCNFSFSLYKAKTILIHFIPMLPRGVFTTQSNIYDGAFCENS